MRLTEERCRRGWSKAELARCAGLNATTISLVESRRFRPYPTQLAKLARALGLPELQAHTLLEDASPSEARLPRAPNDGSYREKPDDCWSVPRGSE